VDGPIAVDWDSAESLSLPTSNLLSDAAVGASFAECPGAAASARNYTAWSKAFLTWLRQNETVTLYRSPKYSVTSGAGETEGEFRVRLQVLANEKRDQAVAAIRKRYASKAGTLEDRLLRAQQAIEREQQQSTKKKLDTAVSFGTAILSAVLGRKRISSSSASRMGTAIRSASGASKEAADVDRAKETAAKVQQDLDTLEKELAAEVATLEDSFDAQNETLDEVRVSAKASDVHVSIFGLLWMPYRDRGDGRLEIALRT